MSLEAEALRARIASTLQQTRNRTLGLTDSVDDGELMKQHSVLMSPLVWDYAHIGNQEELWLVRDVGGRPAVRDDIDQIYDAFQHPRKDRPQLPILKPDEARAYTETVRDKVFDVLDRTTLQGHRLLDDGFAFGMIIQHEQQHDETMLATHQLRSGPAVLAAESPPPPAALVTGEVLIPGGEFTMGTSTHGWALDNERPAHTVAVDSFYLDTGPVTNGQYLEFIDDNGYDQSRWWSTEGWRHRREADLVAPMHWHHDAERWWYTRFGHTTAVLPDEPVVHVSYYEAQAYAKWAGKRLPTEAEWEKAARHDPHTGRSRTYPWGEEPPGERHANLGQRHLRPARIGAYPDGASAYGVHQLIGDVWEWTDTDFGGYPGFRFFPYREYSEVFFGDKYKVLRGGSFGTSPEACRGTFRNWDLPVRRQIFSGFRCARDARPETGC